METLSITFDARHELTGEVGSVKCGLCGEAARGRMLDQGGLARGFGWDCPCGALGIHAPLYDLDELYRDILEAWGLKPRDPDVSPPAPVGESGLLSAVYVDGPALLRGLFAEARSQGAQVASTEVLVRLVVPGFSSPASIWDVVWARAPRQGE
ncbi:MULTISPECIES: hypothetical protein [Myxococcus]|uniref:Uncharacterized protein n=1 Tax=Myxococcus llanfairpwllgwyngyllgogerychwyrndrobwllllantysiliogogogochensis TaxID=2590453 RepID=A0A540X8A9_9BACT|nr:MULTISPECIES: hypothetical protein [Myxococcus]NTX03783.1 hypothetical protein [Myxococcus sp. CA040A]TQF17462.1 hypothetical protein FJV41_03205 [Myxococcus llanfairpwllgwyngyllgogerychwyrndrobwllllantysiliogogogochensis]